MLQKVNDELNTLDVSEAIQDRSDLAFLTKTPLHGRHGLVTSFHVEDTDIASYNSVEHGWKLWIVISDQAEHRNKFEALLRCVLSGCHDCCSVFSLFAWKRSFRHDWVGFGSWTKYSGNLCHMLLVVTQSAN